jgi:hypothetical protein
MSYSYDDVYVLHAWRDNRRRLVLTQGEGYSGTITDNDVIKAPRFQLRDERDVIEIPSSGSPSVQLAVTRSNHTEDLLACTVVDRENGIISCPITKSLTDVSGEVKGEIRLVTANSVTKFYGVDFYIFDGVSDAAAAQSSQFSALIEALQQVGLIISGGSSGTVALDTVIQHNGTKPVASGIIYDYLQGNYRQISFAHENNESSYDDGGVYIDDATDITKMYYVKNSNGARVGILFCVQTPGYNYASQVKIDAYGNITTRVKTKESGEADYTWKSWTPVGTTRNIQDGAVTTPKLADGAVTSTKLASGAVTSDKIDASVVASGIIYDFVTALTALDTTITDNGTKPVASGTLKNYLEGSFQDYLAERFTKRIYAHETHSSGYDADTNPVDTYSDGGVYIDDALDPSTIYIIKNANGAHIGTLLCAHANGYNRTTQIALYTDGRFQYRYRHNTSGVWDEWENIARDSTVFDAVVRNYQDVTPDITFDIHNTAIATYLTESAVYSPNDYDVTKVPTSLSGTPYDTPNTTTIDLPTGSSKVILYDTVAKTEQAISVSGSTYTITNLIPNRVYAYTVRNSSGTMLSYGTVKATGQIRMIDGGGNTFNIRDLGGWTCDGGKTKYGLIYRGAELNGDVSLNSSQVDFFKNVLGIRDEIDLRNPAGTGVGSGALGLGVDYVNIYLNYSPYALQDLYRQERVDIIKRIAKNIKEKKVTYIHCSAGADRTAIICTFIEAICGVSQNDIDRDYELTAFAYDTNNNRLSTRTRSNTWLNGHRAMINGDGTETYSYPYINNMEGSSFQDKIVRFLLRSGVTIDELNDIRFGLIDGNPSKLTNPYGTVTVTSTLSNVVIDNLATTITKYQPYEATLTVEDLHKITSLSITMGGVDASSYYSNGKLYIPIVTGNIVITATGTLLDNQIVVFSHTLTSSGWNSNNEQTITLPSSYTVTSDVIADTEIDSTAYNQLCADGCGGIYISSERSGSTLTLTAHALNNKPTANVTIQVTLTKVSDLSE